jgi:hypothetical protein
MAARLALEREAIARLPGPWLKVGKQPGRGLALLTGWV